MTRCTICALPCPGSDDAPDAWCAWCFARYVAWDTRRPQGLFVVREAEQARRAAVGRALEARDAGREA